MSKLTLKQKVVSVSLLLTMVLLLSFWAYSYYTTISGNDQTENVNVQTGSLALTFSDGSSSFQGSLDFAESATKSFKIENTGDIDAVGHINWLNLKNTYTFSSLTYTLQESTSEDGPYTNLLVDRNVPISDNPMTFVLSDNLTIPVNTTKYYKLIITLNYLESTNQTSDLNAILTTQFSLNEEEIVIDAKTILAKLGKTAKTGNPVFAEQATTDETQDGLYELEDDYGTSYYYRGAVTDNYVKLGKWSDDTPDIYVGFINQYSNINKKYNSLSECQSDDTYNYNCTKISNAGKDMYWRIIRVNGDGSVRIEYDGTSAYENGVSNPERVAIPGIYFNSKYNDNKYIGYMFGGQLGVSSSKRVNYNATGYEDSKNAIYNQTSSNIKNNLETWYQKNLKKDFDEYISDAIFCNDRSIPGKALSGYSDDTGLGYGKNSTIYSPLLRLVSFVSNNQVANENPRPLFKCTNINDSFTLNDMEKGNGALNEKVGLITVDEVLAAGSGKYDLHNETFYLRKGIAYWTMSPYYDINGMPNMFCYGNSHLSRADLGGVMGANPVISLTPEYFNTLIGDGTPENVFRDPNNENEGQ